MPKLISFINLNTLFKVSFTLFLGSFIKILFFSSISHLLDLKKYKFFIESYEILESSIIFLILINSIISGLPKIYGKFLVESFLDNLPFDPTIKILSSLLIFAKKIVF